MSRIMELDGLYLSMDATIQRTRRVVSPLLNSHYNARFGLDLKLAMQLSCFREAQECISVWSSFPIKDY